MPRKSAATVEEQRQQIKTISRRGRKDKTITDEQSIDDFDLAVFKKTAAYLKASGFSYTYIGNSFGISKNVVKKWFADPELQKLTQNVQQDFIDGAVKIMRTYSIELAEIFMEIARDQREATSDRLKAGVELWDRMGLAKVNKSESMASVTKTERQQLEITDTTGLLERARNAPAEVQAKMAEHMEALLAMGQEHAEPVESEEVDAHA